MRLCPKMSCPSLFWLDFSWTTQAVWSLGMVVVGWVYCYPPLAFSDGSPPSLMHDEEESQYKTGSDFLRISKTRCYVWGQLKESVPCRFPLAVLVRIEAICMDSILILLSEPDIMILFRVTHKPGRWWRECLLVAPLPCTPLSLQGPDKIPLLTHINQLHCLIWFWLHLNSCPCQTSLSEEVPWNEKHVFKKLRWIFCWVNYLKRLLFF